MCLHPPLEGEGRLRSKRGGVKPHNEASPFPKNIATQPRFTFRFTEYRLILSANHRRNTPILPREEGTSAVVTDVGAGRGGRIVSQASGIDAYGESVWS